MPLGPRSRAALFGMPLIVSLVVLGLALSPWGVPLYGALPLETGAFDLAHSGIYRLGVRYVESPSPGLPPYTVVQRADWWAGFVATVNESRSYRVTGQWAATDPVMVVVSWDALWTPSSTIAIANYGCNGVPGTFCATSLVVSAIEGTVDVVIGSQNALCTNPADSLGPCVNLGYAMQGMEVGDAASSGGPAGTASVSVTFVSFEAATITVLEPFVVLPA